MSLKKQAIAGIKWTFVQQFSVQIINFAVQIILARLLMPEMFGLIAMVVVFISMGQALMDGGMTSSIIRTKNPDQLDYSTVFITNIIMSLGIYWVVFIMAPYIALFYNQEILTNIIRILSLTFVIRALVAVHMAKLTKEMNFQLQMKLQIPSSILAGLVGITMAYQGYGVWSLVWLNLVQAISFTVQTLVFMKWRPSLIFNFERFKYHFNFGYKLTLASLIDVIFNDAYRIVIGKFYSPAAVGFFHQAETLRLFPVQQISTVIGKVTYPLFAKMNDDNALKFAYKITMKLVLVLIVPLMLGLILMAEEGFRFLFGEKWLSAVPYFQILALASIVRPLSVYNLNILKVKGRSDIFLRIEILKKVIGIALLIVGLNFQVIGLVISLTVFSYISFIINMYFSGNLISYSIKEQLKDTLFLYILGGLVFLLLYFIKYNLNYISHFDFISIFLYIFLFFFIYYLILSFFDKELLDTIKNIRKE
ncbi:polysaccharide biosynthesis protein [Acinetobacter radioresistens WC-A-157]|uniref:lipopolysaccharide biosynthesis protein n=1 Tax=Acinetobacter radioresistens TaxID=40216 RepID=UPI000277D840|nr:lipopolysaccharide biosynthesis protein [Acinetobacter radioresistens]EJO36133.1 polysaccharide biosynthesis protein [Acinetobacter radioresistens WC-A-157]